MRAFTYSADSNAHALYPHARAHTHAHANAAWKQACDYDKPRCLPQSSPRLWERMGRNAKESRRSQAYSTTVGLGRGGGDVCGGEKRVKKEGWILTLYLPLPASSQSAETPFVSAKRWSVPSVYFSSNVLLQTPPQHTHTHMRVQTNTVVFCLF